MVSRLIDVQFKTIEIETHNTLNSTHCDKCGILLSRFDLRSLHNNFTQLDDSVILFKQDIYCKINGSSSYKLLRFGVKAQRS